MQRIIWLEVKFFVKNMASINIKDLAYAFQKINILKLKILV